MQLFKDFLFGISGLSMIFWVSVIAMWHVDMFPRIFKSKDENRFITSSTAKSMKNSSLSLVEEGSLRPSNMQSSLIDRSKYKRKSILIADLYGLEIANLDMSKISPTKQKECEDDCSCC